MPSFVHRRINVSFSMGQGATGEAGLTNSKLTGLRVSCKVLVAGDGAQSTCSLQVYGMTLDMMNRLSVVGLQVTSQKKNTVLVEAGDDENGMNVVFQGTITHAWPDMQNQPQVVFRVEANAGKFMAVKPAEPTSFSGPTEVSLIAQQLADKMGLSFENNGVNKKLSDPYFFGSARSQMMALAKAARIAWIDENETKLAIWPFMGSRSGGALQISKTTGMVADPIGTPTGILVKVLYSRPLQFGSTVEVQSIITQANGTWAISRVDYSLESEMPHGEWFVTIDAYKASEGQQGPQMP